MKVTSSRINRKNASGPSAHPPTVHWSVIGNGISGRVDVTKHFIRKGNGWGMSRYTGTELRISGNVWWSHRSKFTFFGLKSSSMSIDNPTVSRYLHGGGCVRGSSGVGSRCSFHFSSWQRKKEKAAEIQRRAFKRPRERFLNTSREFRLFSRIKTPNIDFPAVPCLFAQFNKLLHPFSKHSLKTWGFCTVCNCKLVHN